MMTGLALFLAAICAACGGGGGGDEPNTLVAGGYDQQEMDAAIARARSEVDTFIATMTSGNGSDFAVKIPVEDDGETEHFWLTDISYSDGEFSGLIGNDPGIVSNVTFGQAMKIDKSAISDWMYMRDGKMYGNYTLRPLLATMDEKQAAFFRSMLAEP
jgi:uncharacterized protein YegJ (DUF2314 family)